MTRRCSKTRTSIWIAIRFLRLSQNAIPQQQHGYAESAGQAVMTRTRQKRSGHRGCRAAQCHILQYHLAHHGHCRPAPGRFGAILFTRADSTGLIVRWVEDQPISAIFTISEDQLPPLLPKSAVANPRPVDAWDREMKNKLAEGQFSNRRGQQIDQTTGTVKLRAVFCQ